MKMGSECGNINRVVKGASSRVHGSSKTELEVQKNETACLVKRVGEQSERNKERSCHFEKPVTYPVRYKYEFGDMVWGKIKSYPWWPGQVFNEAFAVSDVHKTKKDRHILIAFFGDGTYGWLDPLDIIPFDSIYFEKSKQTNAKDFVKAIKEAELEISRRAALGLFCQCRNPSNFRQMSIDGFFEVDVCGHVPGVLYSIKQIKSARAGFQPVEMISFIKQLGSMPCKNFQSSVQWIKSVATVLAYRRVLFKENDGAYLEAFGRKSPSLVNSKVASIYQHDKVPILPIPDKAHTGATGVHSASPVDSRMVLTWQDKVSRGASVHGSVEVDTSLGISKISAGHTMEGGTVLYEEKDGRDMLKVHYDFQGQQTLLSSSYGKASHIAGTVILGKRDAIVPNKTEFQCQIERNDISARGNADLSLCLAGKESKTVDKRPMLKRSGLIDVRVDWESNCENDLLSSLKPPKKRFKPDKNDKIRLGSCPSDTEKMRLAGPTTLNERKPSSAGKKVLSDKPSKSHGTGAEDVDLKIKVKRSKNSLKNVETPGRVRKPAMLVMQFPRQSKLPSVSELKAKFALFGPFENSPRVFWKSSTCQIVFIYEYNAQVARRYAMLNRSLFGNVNILYEVQVLKVPTPVLPKPSKQSLEATCSKVPGFTSIIKSYSTESMSKEPAQQQQLPRIHQQSCLKKPRPDGEQFTKAKSRGNLHVNFTLSKDESNIEEQFPVNSIIQRPNGDHPSGVSSCFDDDTIPLPPWLPHSYWISNALENDEVCKFVKACNERYLEDEKRSNQMLIPTQNVDVSSAMLNHLVRCSNILADLKNFLGYVPYHF